MKCSYLKKVDNSIIYDGDYLEIYIPKSNFDTGASSSVDEYLETLGVFNFVHYPEGPDKPDKKEIRSLTLAFKIKIGFSRTFNIKTKLSNDIEEDDYRVYVLEKGDVFCLNTKQAKSSTNTKELIFMLHGGKLPNGVPYNKVLDIYYGSASLNQVNLRSQLVIYECIVSELCRYKDDKTLPFRLKIGDSENKNLTEHDYSIINIKELPSLNSTFASLTFENINKSVISSLKKTKNGEEEKETPTEKVLKY